MNSIFK
jgi:hypothetical protein